MTDPPDEWLSRAFAALSDPVRRDIIAYDMSLQAVSKHVKVLADAGLVSQRKEAQRRPVHLESRALAEMTGWIERHQQRAEQRMTRLEEVLADLPSSDTTGTSDTHGAGQ